MRKVIVIMALVIASGCRVSRKQNTNTILVKHDTIIRESVIKQEFHDTSFVDFPCDSAGILKAFQQTIQADGVVVRVFNDSGRIKTVVVRKTDTITKERIVSSDSSSVVKIDYREVIKYKTPRWAYFLLIVNVLSACIWLGIRKVKSLTNV